MSASVPYNAWANQVATPDVFGPILGARDVRQALDTTIQTWANTYIAEVAATTGVAAVPLESWEALYLDRALPASIVATCWSTCWMTDAKRPPERQGDGTYRAFWVAQAHLVVPGTDWDEAADLMGVYLSAVRAAVVQHRSLGGVANDTRWMGEAVREIERTARRTTEEGVIQFMVTVDGVVDDSLGPATTTTAPGTAGNETVTSVNATLVKEPTP